MQLLLDADSFFGDGGPQKAEVSAPVTSNTISADSKPGPPAPPAAVESAQLELETIVPVEMSSVHADVAATDDAQDDGRELVTT